MQQKQNQEVSQSGNFEKVNLKIETNSRGFNTSVHVYQGASQQEIDDTISKVVYAHNELQKRLRSSTVEENQ